MSLQCGCATRLHIAPVYIQVLFGHDPLEFQTATRDPMPSQPQLRGEGKDARHANESVDCRRSAVASARASPRQSRSSSKSPQ